MALLRLGYRISRSDDTSERKASLAMALAEDPTHGRYQLNLVSLTNGREWGAPKGHRCSSAPTM